MEREEKKDVKRKRYRKEEQYVVLRVCERGKREIEARKKREKERNARVAQLVERDLAKVEAAGSSPVSRLHK